MEPTLEDFLKEFTKVLPSFILSQERIADGLQRIAKAQEDIVEIARSNSKESQKSLKGMTKAMKQIANETTSECATCNGTQENGCAGWCFTAKFPKQ